MSKHLGRWTLAVLVGLLVIGLVGVGIVQAQGPSATATPNGARGVCGGMGLGMRFGGTNLGLLAEGLGMTSADLTTALQGGKTIADLAKDKNVTIASLVDKLIAARKDALQQQVDAGRITAEQMATMLDTMRAQMTENLTNGTCAPGMGRGQNAGAGCGMGMRGGGMGNRWGGTTNRTGRSS